MNFILKLKKESKELRSKFFKTIDRLKLKVAEKGIKKITFITISGVILIFLFWLFYSRIEVLFFKKIQFNSYEQTASIRNSILSKKYQEARPIFKKDVEYPQLAAQAALSIRINENNNAKILFSKNEEKALPIASLTKLVSAIIVLENYKLDDKITVSSSAATKEGDANFFAQGEVFYVNDLLSALLIESSNKATQALADAIGEKKFIDLMNSKTKEIGMENSFFINPTGLDPDKPQTKFNYSTANDLAMLARNLIEMPLIQELTTLKRRNVYLAEDGFHHQARSTNELLGEIPNILIGKTGNTPLAQKCLLIVYQSPNKDGYIISIILNAQDNFAEMRKLVNWTMNSYKW